MTKIYSWENLANIVGAIVIIILMYVSLYNHNTTPYFKILIPLISAVAGWVLNDNMRGEKE